MLEISARVKIHLNKLDKTIYDIIKIYGTHFLIITFYLLFVTFIRCWQIFTDYSAGIYLLKVNNENTKRINAIFSKLTLKAPERIH